MTAQLREGGRERRIRKGLNGKLRRHRGRKDYARRGRAWLGQGQAGGVLWLEGQGLSELRKD